MATVSNGCAECQGDIAAPEIEPQSAVAQSIQAEKFQHKTHDNDKADDIDNGVHFVSSEGFFANHSQTMNLL
jgi:hypothetical protein